MVQLVHVRKARSLLRYLYRNRSLLDFTNQFHHYGCVTQRQQARSMLCSGAVCKAKATPTRWFQTSILLRHHLLTLPRRQKFYRYSLALENRLPISLSPCLLALYQPTLSFMFTNSLLSLPSALAIHIIVSSKLSVRSSYLNM